MSLPIRSLAVLAIAATALAAQAQTITKRKPGLWEVQTTSSMGEMPNMKEMLANVPPEQRAMVEKMMKERGVGAGAAPSSFRFCMSKEQAERDPTVNPDPNTDCSHKLTPVSASEAKFAVSCKRKDGSTMDGEGRAFDLTPTSYAMDMKMKIQQAGQGPMNVQMNQRAKWLGSDCQGIAPVGK